jgi:glc operon protein GlcG
MNNYAQDSAIVPGSLATSPLVTATSIGRALARVGIDAAVSASESLERRTCIAVVDAAGHLVSFERIDGAPFQTITLAQAKAFSVAGNLTATHDYWDGIKDEPWLVHGVQRIDGLIVLGGGLPICHHDTIIGAVGVSGKSTMAEDQAIAEAAVTAILSCLDGANFP